MSKPLSSRKRIPLIRWGRPEMTVSIGWDNGAEGILCTLQVCEIYSRLAIPTGSKYNAACFRVKPSGEWRNGRRWGLKIP